MDARRRRLLLAAAALALTLGGCASGVSDGGGAGSGGDDAGSQAEQAGAGGGVAVDRDVDDVEGPREIVVTATASVLVDDPAASAARVAALVETSGGRVESRDVYAGTDADVDPGWASLVVRVPSDELSAVLDDLAEVGTVTSTSQTQEDVTAVGVDLDARITALETSTARLAEIMASAGDTGDLLATETQLSERQAELESLQAQRTALSDQVAMSTLTVSLDSQPAPPVVAQDGFLGGLERGWSALAATAGVLVGALGTLRPWVAALGVPTAVAVALVRRRRRRDVTA
jgi:hypothetical protein